MKKYLLMITLALLLTLSQMNFALGAQSDGYIHKNHYYAVSFDGEGDAIVRAQIDIENTLSTQLSSIDLEIPGQIVVYKAVQESPSRNQLEYEKIVASNATILHIELKEPIRTNGTGTIVLFYKIPVYAQKDIFGNYSFDFKTIIDKDAILVENMRVAVNVQEGLFLKGGESKVDYRQSRPGLSFVSESAMMSTSAKEINSQYYQDYYYTIRNATGLVKTASNLDPFESFHVKGTYGENWLGLYFLDTAGLIIIAGIILTGLLFAFRKGAKKLNLKTIEKNIYAKSALVAFASAMAIIIISIILVLASAAITKFSYQLQWVSLILGLLGLLISFGLLFLPALYVSSKNGIMQGALTFFLTIIFLIMLGISLIVLIQVLFSTPTVVY